MKRRTRPRSVHISVRVEVVRFVLSYELSRTWTPCPLTGLPCCGGTADDGEDEGDEAGDGPENGDGAVSSGTRLPMYKRRLYIGSPFGGRFSDQISPILPDNGHFVDVCTKKPQLIPIILYKRRLYTPRAAPCLRPFVRALMDRPYKSLCPEDFW